MPRNANQSKSSNYSMNFNSASSQRVDISSVVSTISSSSTGSISFWVKPQSSSIGYMKELISFSSTSTQDQYLQVYKTSAEKLNVNIRNKWNLETDSAVFSVDTWLHVIITHNGTEAEIYINGSKPSQTFLYNQTDYNYWWPNLTNLNTANIGANFWLRSTGARQDFGTGIVLFSEVAIFDYALSASQVTTLWGGGTSVSNPMALPRTPIAYYPLGTSAWDGSFLAENNAIGDYVFSFDGTSNYIDCGSFSLNANAGTGSAWIKSSNTSDFQMIIGKYVSSSRQVQFRTQTDGKIRLILYKSHTVYSLLDSTGTVLDGNWHHVAFTYNSSGINLYIDGSASGSDTTNFTPVQASTDNFMIGARKISAPQKFFDGSISNVQIFNTALSPTEITTLYNYGSPIRTLANIPQNSNLKAWYKLDASEIYNSSSTEWEINEATSPWTSSLNFNGSAGVTTAGITGIATSNSISFWFNNSIAAGGQAPLIASLNYISGALQNFAIRLETTNKMQVVLKNGSTFNILESTTTFTNNTWHFITLTTSTSGSNVTSILYVNGVSEDSLTNTTNSNLADLVNGLTIGYWLAPGSETYNFNGSISNVAIYNTALSAPNVLTLYNNGTPQATIYGSPIAHWKLDNTTTGIQDSAGNYNATNSGAVKAIGSVSTLNGKSSGMSQSNLVQSDLQTVAPYSKYAMNFDGANDGISMSATATTPINPTGTYSISAWVKPSNVTSFNQIFTKYGPTDSERATQLLIHTDGKLRLAQRANNTTDNTFSTSTISANVWTHVAVVRTTSSVSLYINGNLDGGVQSNSFVPNNGGTQDLTIGKNNNGEHTTLFTGSISNVSIWNSALTSSQVREIYNEGLPGNLNSHSAYSNLVSWWQLGENSSFASNWICADEKGTNNGESQNMGVDALTNGVGTTANGLSSGMAVGALVGDAPYSTANAISSGMAVTARVTGSGNTP